MIMDWDKALRVNGFKLTTNQLNEIRKWINLLMGRAPWKSVVKVVIDKNKFGYRCRINIFGRNCFKAEAQGPNPKRAVFIAIDEIDLQIASWKSARRFGSNSSVYEQDYRSAA